MFLLWNIQLRSICPGFPRFSVPFPACREFAIFPPATWSLWFGRLRLASHWFPLTSCHSAGLLHVFSLGFFHFFFCCDYERELWSLGSFHTVLSIFLWFLLLKNPSSIINSCLSMNQFLPLYFWLCCLRRSSACFICRHKQFTSSAWSYAPHSTQIVSRGPLKTSYCAQIK